MLEDCPIVVATWGAPCLLHSSFGLSWPWAFRTHEIFERISHAHKNSSAVTVWIHLFTHYEMKTTVVIQPTPSMLIIYGEVYTKKSRNPVYYS